MSISCKAMVGYFIRLSKNDIQAETGMGLFAIWKKYSYSYASFIIYCEIIFQSDKKKICNWEKFETEHIFTMGIRFDFEQTKCRLPNIFFLDN